MLFEVCGSEDLLHELLAELGCSGVVDSGHDRAGFRALNLLLRERARHDRHVGRDRALLRALCTRRAKRARRQQ
jgi:hypothetical protein